MSSPVELYTITEGPTNIVVITAVLDAMEQSYVLHTLQPEGDGLNGLVRSDHGLGWRDGVRAFCQNEHEAIDFARAQEHLRALGLVELLECHDNPEAWLTRVALTKTPTDYEGEREHIVAGWPNARGLPEAQRFEDELRPALVCALLLRGL